MTRTGQRHPRGVWLLVVGAGLVTVLAAGFAVSRPVATPMDGPSSSPGVASAPGSSSDLPVVGPLGGVRIPPRDPEPWTAVDWREVPRAFGAKPDRALDRIDGTIVGRHRMIGWGRVSQPGRNQFNDMGAMYLSSDGINWRVTPIDAGVRRQDASEFSLVADGPAGILILGNVCCTEEERPALWLAADGGTLDRLPWPDTFGVRSEISTLAATESLYLAGGTAAGSAAVWSSPDGAAWTRIEDPAAGLGAGGLFDIEPAADGLVAVGWQDVDGTSDGAVWTSPTGAEWRRLPVALLEGPLETTIYRVVPWAGGWFLIGQEGTHADRIACEGIARVASVSDPEGGNAPPPDFSCGWGVETHWLTADGRDWQRDIPIGAQPGAVIPDGALIELRLISAGGPGLVVLGEGSRVGSAGIFVSADGIRWQVTAPGGVFPGGSIPNGLAVGGRTIVAVVEGPSAWIGLAR